MHYQTLSRAPTLTSTSSLSNSSHSALSLFPLSSSPFPVSLFLTLSLMRHTRDASDLSAAFQFAMLINVSLSLPSLLSLALSQGKVSHDSIKQLVLEAEHLVRDAQEAALKTPTKQKHSIITISSTVKKRELTMPGPIKQRVEVADCRYLSIDTFTNYLPLSLRHRNGWSISPRHHSCWPHIAAFTHSWRCPRPSRMIVKPQERHPRRIHCHSQQVQSFVLVQIHPRDSQTQLPLACRPARTPMATPRSSLEAQRSPLGNQLLHWAMAAAIRVWI